VDKRICQLSSEINTFFISNFDLGVIDTDMQTDLRSAKGAGFPDQHMFVQMKNTGALTTPAVAAAHILAYLQRPDFGSNPVADVRDI
jgi:hypothetical protein